MTINSKILLCLIFLIAQTRTGSAGDAVHALNDPSSQEQLQIATVDYCDLIRNQAKYAGQVIRVKVVMLAFVHHASLYDAGCKEEGLEAVLDCKDDEECSAMRKALNRDMDYNGDVGRVEAVFTGSLVLPVKTADPKSHARFMIKRVERTERISRDTPWP
jgi:hypothetical protein